jgi:type IV pilus assembly protein PilF
MKLKTIFLLVIILTLAFCVSAQKKLNKEREKDPHYQYNMGLFYLDSGDPDEAIKYFNNSLVLNPRNYLVFNALGFSYSMKGDLRQSLKFFQKCLEVNPNFTEAHNNIGMIYQEMGFIDKAEEEFKKVLADEKYSSKENAYYNIANLYFIQGKMDKALDNIQKAIQKNIRFAMGYNLKGRILEKQNELSKAIESYERALKIVPGEIIFSFDLAVALFKNSEYSRAEEIFEKISPQVTDPEMKDNINKYLKIIRERGKN